MQKYAAKVGLPVPPNVMPCSKLQSLSVSYVEPLLIILLSVSPTCVGKLNIVQRVLSTSQLVLSQSGTEKQTSCLQKQSARPAAVSSQEHRQDRHLHLPETRKCVKGVSGSRRCKQKS